MSNFSWQTEDEFDFEDEIVEEMAERRGFGRFLPLLLIPLLLATGITIRRSINNQVQEATESTEEAVRSTAQLLFERAEQGDIELFNELISGRDREWTATQQQMMGDGSLLQRDGLRLTLLNENPTIRDVELSADLRSAEITAITQYTDSLGILTFFELPVIFRQGSSQWLYAPPDDEFWGDTFELTRSNLQIAYPSRDDQLVRRLGDDLAVGFDQLCTNNSPLCEEVAQIEIEFVTTAGSLQSLTDPISSETSSRIRLPAPSLIGLPADEAAYRALLAGYANQIFTPIILEATSYKCCRHSNHARAIIDRMLVESDLLEDTIHTDIYRTVLNNNLFANEFDAGWRSTVDNRVSHAEAETITVLIDFLRSQKVEPIAMLGSLHTYFSTKTWLQSAYSDSNLDVAIFTPIPGSFFSQFQPFSTWFTEYLIENSVSTMQHTPPVELPQTQFAFVCSESDEQGSTLYTYNVAADTFTTVLQAEKNILQAELVAEPDSWLLTYGTVDQQGRGSGTHVELLRNGESIEIGEGNSAWFRDGEIFVWAGQAYRSVRLDECTTEQCELQTGDSLNKSSSPNGTYYFYWQETDTDVFDAEGNVVLTLDAFRGPVYWLSDSVLLIEKQSTSVMTETTRYTIDMVTGEQTEWKIVDRIIAELYPEDQPETLDSYLQFSDATIGEMLIRLYARDGMGNFRSSAVIVDLKTEAILFEVEGGVRNISADFNRLIVDRLSPELDYGTPNQIVVWNRESETYTERPHLLSAFGSYSYSRVEAIGESAEWLVVFYGSRLHLFAADHAYDRYIPLPSDNCTGFTILPTP